MRDLNLPCIKEISDFITKRKPNILGLLETTIKSKNKRKAIIRVCPAAKYIANNTGNSERRILVLWDSTKCSVSLTDFSAQLVDCFCRDLQTKESFFLTFVYAKNTAREKLPLSEDLKQISHYRKEPWLVAGDFNCVRNAAEKKGDWRLNEKLVAPFNDCIPYCGLEEIKQIRGQWTWCNEERDISILLAFWMATHQ